MRFLLLLILLPLDSCNNRKYYGYIYDYETQQPLSDVEVNDFMNDRKTVSDMQGFFLLEHESKTSGKLILKKGGYDIDTLETIKSYSGEQFLEEFKGDTIYMFSTESNFRDSIYKLNTIRNESK